MLQPRETEMAGLEAGVLYPASALPAGMKTPITEHASGADHVIQTVTGSHHEAPPAPAQPASSGQNAPRKALKPEADRPLRFLGDENGLSLYLREISRTKNLSLSEEGDLALRIRQGDRRALNKLITANLKFVVSVCRNYQNQGLPLTDLINEGNLGLIRAAKRFDETKHFKFISYAVWWIRQAILQSLAEQSRIINIPLNRVSAIHRIGKSAIRLEQKLGRSVSPMELSGHLDLQESEISECVQLASSPVSLEAPLQADEEGRLGDVLKDDNGESPEEPVMRENLKDEVKRVLGTLATREEEVVRLYFGIGVDTGYTLEEIGVRFNLTRERVRQIKEKALKRLKHSSRSKRLNPFQY